MEGEAAAAAAATHSLLYEGVLLLGAALVFVKIGRAHV